MSRVQNNYSRESFHEIRASGSSYQMKKHKINEKILLDNNQISKIFYTVVGITLFVWWNVHQINSTVYHNRRRDNHLDYRNLYKFWQAEKASVSLLEIPADFYISMDGKLTKLYQKTQNLEWEELAEEIIERMEFLRKDIARLRLTKILNSVIHNMPIELSHTTWGERRLIKDLRNSIEMLGMEKPNILDTQEILASTNLQNDSNEKSSQIEENREASLPSSNNLTIRILDDVEAFIGLDEKRYGPLIRHDIVHLPVENAKALIARGMARLIETETVEDR